MASIGEKISISCNANTLYGVMETPTLTLKHPNGTNLSTVVGEKLSVVLYSVNSTDIGEYTCYAEVNFSGIDNLRSFTQAKQYITFKCK